MESLGIDIGGTGIKGAIVDVRTGELMSERLRIATPQPSTPDAVADAVGTITRDHGWDGPVGIAVPGVVHEGVVRTAANIDPSWMGTDAAALMAAALRRDVTVLNDADAAGIGETRFGAGRDKSGVVLLLTFGTGIGSALIHNGVLVPNTELGHLEFRGIEAEQYAAGRLVKRGELDLAWWAQRVNELLGYLEMLFSPSTFIIGGGISKRFSEFSSHLDTMAETVPAKLRNNAGIVGAARMAFEESTR